jgi:hypothetical protein
MLMACEGVCAQIGLDAKNKGKNAANMRGSGLLSEKRWSGFKALSIWREGDWNKGSANSVWEGYRRAAGGLLDAARSTFVP